MQAQALRRLPIGIWLSKKSLLDFIRAGAAARCADCSISSTVAAWAADGMALACADEREAAKYGRPASRAGPRRCGRRPQCDCASSMSLGTPSPLRHRWLVRVGGAGQGKPASVPSLRGCPVSRCSCDGRFVTAGRPRVLLRDRADGRGERRLVAGGDRASRVRLVKRRHSGVAVNGGSVAGRRARMPSRRRSGRALRAMKPSLLAWWSAAQASTCSALISSAGRSPKK